MNCKNCSQPLPVNMIAPYPLCPKCRKARRVAKAAAPILTPEQMEGLHGRALKNALFRYFMSEANKP